MPDTAARLVYLLLLLLAVGGYLIAALRNRPAQALQQLMVWAFIFLGIVALAGLWPDVRDALLPRQAVLAGGRIEAPIAPDGHYYLNAEVNGVALRFMVDTGASQIVLTRADAARVGIDTENLAYVGQATSANGLVATAPVVLQSLALGPVADADVPAVVNRGELDQSLLGMSWLTRFSRVEFQPGRLILER